MLSTHRVRQLFALHRWMGLATGVFILFFSLTGSLLVFKVEIDRLLNPRLLVSEPGERMVGIDRALDAVRRAYPRMSVDAVEPPRSPGAVYSFAVSGDDPITQVTVDPRTGRVLGGRDRQASFADVMRQTHVRFYAFSWYGRVVVGLFGVTLVVSTLTGLLIYGRFIRALPHWWSVRRERGLQIAASDWHKLVGILSLAFNLVIAVTGAVLGLENLTRFAPRVGEAIHPGPSETVLADVPESLAGAIPPSEAVRRVRAAIPGFQPAYLTFPEAGEGHYGVYGGPAGRVTMENASGAVVHTHTGEVLYRHDEREARAITRAYNWMDPLHFGTWGGVASRILYVLFGLTTGILSVTGYVVWWMKRRRTGRTAASGRSARGPTFVKQVSG